MDYIQYLARYNITEENLDPNIKFMLDLNRKCNAVRDDVMQQFNATGKSIYVHTLIYNHHFPLLQPPNKITIFEKKIYFDKSYNKRERETQKNYQTLP